jgi:hypothetical protein
MARGGLFHFGQGSDTEEDYDRKKREEAIERKKAEGATKPTKGIPLGSGGAGKAQTILEGRGSQIKKLEDEYGI